MSSLFEFSAALNNDPFDKFWGTYPRKEAKKDARKAWDQAVRQVEPRVIQLRLEQQVKLWKGCDPQFIPYPATWLRRTDFNEEQKPAEYARPQPKYIKDVVPWKLGDKPPDWSPEMAAEFIRQLQEAKGKNRL